MAPPRSIAKGQLEKADICSVQAYVRFGPKADISPVAAKCRW